MSECSEKPWFLRILPDLLAFGIGLGIACSMNWKTRDLVWSLWLCSLVLGYLTLLSAVSGAAYCALSVMKQKEFDGKQHLPIVLFSAAIGVFVLVFFSIHFCGFHAVHSVFLRHFFPIDGMPEDGFGRAFINPALLWVLAFRYLMVPYGVFLIPAIIAERRHVFLPLVSVAKGMRTDMPPGGLVADTTKAWPDFKSFSVGEAMRRPYMNVIRMHLLIFFFAFCYFLKFDSFLVYAVVYSVYFFPWGEIKKLRMARNRG